MRAEVANGELPPLCLLRKRSGVLAHNSANDDVMLTPTGYPPNTAANMAHSTHSTRPALRPHRATPRVEDKSRRRADPTQTNDSSTKEGSAAIKGALCT